MLPLLLLVSWDFLVRKIQFLQSGFSPDGFAPKTDRIRISTPQCFPKRQAISPRAIGIQIRYFANFAAVAAVVGQHSPELKLACESNLPLSFPHQFPQSLCR